MDQSTKIQTQIKEWVESSYVQSDLFAAWRMANDGGPRLQDFLPYLASRCADHPLWPIACMAAQLGDEHHNNPFHGNPHFREVTATGLKLGHAANMSVERILMLFIATSLHDYKHDGKGNTVDGVHEPMRLERQSWEEAEKRLITLVDKGLVSRNIYDDFIVKFRAIIAVTDVTKPAGGTSPAELLVKIYDAHNGEGVFPEVPDDVMMPLIEDRELCEVAMYAEAADLIPSAAICPEHTRITSFAVEDETALQDEKSKIPATPASAEWFIDNICKNLLKMPVVRQMFEQSLEVVKAETAKDKAAGLTYR
ncbi:MAG: hypothetical protein GC136_09900 [Alphaproteobacteria bacterium]|nr:hypothetical protein [Alphaproteobacteria bacterium]